MTLGIDCFTDGLSKNFKIFLAGQKLTKLSQSNHWVVK
jgi:hypothetical protein